MDEVNILPIGTRIRFLKTLDCGATEDHPPMQYAQAGETGVITGYGTREGYWVKVDSWPHAFGASREEFEPCIEPPLPTPKFSMELMESIKRKPPYE